MPWRQGKTLRDRGGHSGARTELAPGAGAGPLFSRTSTCPAWLGSVSLPPSAPGKDPPCLFRLPVDPGAPQSLPRSHTAIFCPLFPSARGLLLCAWVFASDFPLFIRVRGHPTAVGPCLNRSHLQAPCFQIKPHSRVLGRGLQTSLPGTRLSP